MFTAEASLRGHASFSVAAVHADPLSVLAEAVWVSRQAERPLPVCVTAYLWFCFHAVRLVMGNRGTNAWNWEATFRLFSINMLSLSLPQWWDELCWDTFSFRFSGCGTLVLSAAAFIFSCLPSVPVFLSVAWNDLPQSHRAFLSDAFRFLLLCTRCLSVLVSHLRAFWQD